MVLLRDFGVERHDLNPQNSAAIPPFKSVVRLEFTQKPSFVDAH